jgi:hypothetical protein
MSENILNIGGEKVVHKQGPNWNVVGRYEDFDSADFRRQAEIAAGRTAKVHKLASVFVVKVKPFANVTEITSTETKVDPKKERPSGKQKRQDRDNKR